MLELRPNCKCCDRDLAPDTREAMICSFECTYCADCARKVLAGTCPNYGGELVRRPIRPSAGPARPQPRFIEAGGQPRLPEKGGELATRYGLASVTARRAAACRPGDHPRSG